MNRGILRRRVFSFLSLSTSRRYFLFVIRDSKSLALISSRSIFVDSSSSAVFLISISRAEILFANDSWIVLWSDTVVDSLIWNKPGPFLDINSCLWYIRRSDNGPDIMSHFGDFLTGMLWCIPWCIGVIDRSLQGMDCFAYLACYNACYNHIATIKFSKDN